MAGSKVNVGYELVPSLLGRCKQKRRCKQKQRGLRGLLCRWPSITEWEMYITAQGCRLRNDLDCVEWDVKLYYTIPFSQTMASEWKTAFAVSHKMPWCALLTAVKNCNKSLEKLQDFFFKTETKCFSFLVYLFIYFIFGRAVD